MTVRGSDDLCRAARLRPRRDAGEAVVEPPPPRVDAEIPVELRTLCHQRACAQIEVRAPQRGYEAPMDGALARLREDRYLR